MFQRGWNYQPEIDGFNHTHRLLFIVFQLGISPSKKTGLTFAAVEMGHHAEWWLVARFVSVSLCLLGECYFNHLEMGDLPGCQVCFPKVFTQGWWEFESPPVGGWNVAQVLACHGCFSMCWGRLPHCLQHSRPSRHSAVGMLKALGIWKVGSTAWYSRS